ncbi:hypothetical protein SY88_10550 [Clostridiales bacterium PH28_bin88]|nr:hypothetical protein SY88_10550 [Clostridiales bacterium PH28_bin88]
MKHELWLKYMVIPLKRMWRNLTARRLLWGWAFFFATTVILGANLIPQNIHLEVGQPSPQDFVAKHNLTYPSEVRTEAARQEAAKSVKPSYKVDDSVLQELEREIVNYFTKVAEIRTSGLEEQAQVERLKQELKLSLSPETVKALAGISQEEITNLEEDLLQLVRKHMGNGIQREAVDTTRDRMLSEVERLPVAAPLRSFLSNVLATVRIEPNLVYDPLGTARDIRAAQEAVGPVQVSIKKDQIIVRQRDPVTEDHIEQLQKLGLLRTQSPYVPLLGLAMLVMVAYVLLFFYVYQYQRSLFQHEPYFILLGLLMVTTMVFTKGFVAINLGNLPESATVVGYLAPVAAGAMLIAILLDTKLAVFSVFILAIFTGIITGQQLQFAVVAMAGGLAGVYSVSRLSQRTDLAKSSLYIILANTSTVAAMGFLQTVSLTGITLGMVMGIINGVLSAILTIGSLPFLETAFGITTSVRLLELSNPNQPLLKRMLLEAPGTYHHSVMVGNLAEAAADAVGADSLLARVGAYYHDIGKVKRPYFFIENQFTAENPHDKLTPTLSTLIITSHVKDGLEMARTQRLPKVICDIIEQHHGTSLISFFYHKALDNDRTESVVEGDFRYETRKPQSKEAAIVMLADSVEAAVRSLQKPTPGRMEGLVRRIIKDKLDDGQLEASDLTFRELDCIAQAFVRVLSGIFHSRIEYPDTVLKELERRRAKDAAFRTKPAG